ncbi:MAG: peptidoglycan synthetase [Bacteroidales bacterium]|nr:peptidoglycan synthetase [Bacteroidales bacterium]
MKLHFIAIGGAAMHNIAIALHLKGNTVTGSDDEIFEPSESRLRLHGLLPPKPGWYPEKITADTDAVILGMHARENNPELLKALELKCKIFSFPEFLYEQTRNKMRVVVGGSHGKTTITSMIMHVLKKSGVKFDYMVGSQVEGFETMAGLSDESGIAVFEGDEYLASPVDPRPKFHLYKPHIAVISGIAWDHINVFPTFSDYCSQFRKFTDQIEENGALVYYKYDQQVKNIVRHLRGDIKRIPYDTHDHIIKNNETYLVSNTHRYKVAFFGRHNMQNISAALKVCEQLGIAGDDFYNAIQSFTGAKKRLELIHQTMNSSVFIDFAHSPSKLKATIEAVKSQFPGRRLIACIELHTFSSLTKEFLHEYRDTMDRADKKVVFYNPETLRHKRLEMLDTEYIKESFGDSRIIIFNDRKSFKDFLCSGDWNGYNILLMSSGNFSDIDFQEIIDTIR